MSAAASVPPKGTGGYRPRRRTPPGTAPGTLVSDPTLPSATVRVIRYDATTFSENEIEADALRLPEGDDSITWIDVIGVGDADQVTRICEIFGLHRLALEDVVHVHQRPKVEAYDNDLFIVFRMAAPGVPGASEQVSLFMRPGLVLTFQERHGDSFEPVRNRIRQGRGIIRGVGADYLTYALIDAALDHYFPVLEDCDNRLDDLTEDVLRNPRNEIVSDLHQLKRELFNLRQIIWASREMINNLMRDEHSAITASTRTYLRDAYDHCIQLMDMLEMQRDVAASLFDIYLSSLSNRLNEIMKVLTMIATIFIPLGFIASLYGMNFDRASPWNMPELGWRFGYPVSLAVMIATAAGLVWWFRKKGWIGNGKRRRRTIRRAPRPGP